MPSLVARPAVAFLIAAVLAGASQSGSVRAQETSPDSTLASTGVVVELADRLGGISPLLYEVNHRYGYYGFGM